MKKSEIINKAINLRRKGLSYKVVGDKLGISHNTSYLWLKNIKLNSIAQRKLAMSLQNGRLKGVNRNLENRMRRNLKIATIARTTVSNIEFNVGIMKSFCALLYWAEGGKTGIEVAFANSDPAMIRTFLYLFRHGFEVNDHKIQAFLHLHNYHNISKQINFWSKITDIPKNKIIVYNKVNSGKNIRINYPGCISIRYSDVQIFNEIKYLYKILSRRMS